MRPAASCRSQLWHFVSGVLVPAVPRLGWLVLGLAGLSSLNLLLLPELWPHQPKAEDWFILLLLGCLLVLPWLGAYTAQRVRPHLTNWWWRMIWQLIIFGAYGVAAMSLGLLCLGALLGLLSRW